MGCDIHPPQLYRGTEAISIHAPTWGATDEAGKALGLPVDISIHAPTWGATVYYLTNHHFGDNFNPRTHMGCDDKPDNVNGFI